MYTQNIELLLLIDSVFIGKYYNKVALRDGAKGAPPQGERFNEEVKNGKA
jgi:hypothetical protein